MTTNIASNSWEHCSEVAVILVNPVLYFLQEGVNIIDALEHIFITVVTLDEFILQVYP